MTRLVVNDPMQRTPYWRLWLAFFAYPAILALFVQLILLPHIFPTWHAGDGMLAGGDWYPFHRMAADLAEKIHEQGWSAWELRPSGQGPVGIAAAIYALTVPKPWTVIPLNAALHATATVLLLILVQLFLPKWRLTIWSTLPFLLYPSAMIWYTQIHKDGYSIVGVFAFIYGWVIISRLESWEKGWWPALSAILWILSGAGLVWVVRPYAVQMLLALGVVLAIGLVFIFLFRAMRFQLAWTKAIIVSVLVWLVVFSITPFTRGGLPLGSVVVSEGNETPVELEKMQWFPSAWLPGFLEDEFFTLADTRRGYTTGKPDAGSNIDIDIVFHSATDVVAYLPRAAQIVFLAPFPTQWFEEGSLPANTVMRRVSGVEMIGNYIALAFLPYAIWRWRKRIEIWVILILCTGMMLVYGLAVANIGTLYRMRYGFMMTLVALGITGALALWEDRRKERKSKQLQPEV